jgi:hypothetical protein
VLGSCAGARVAVNLAAGDGGVSALGLLIPPVSGPVTGNRKRETRRLARRIARGLGLRPELRPNREWIRLLRSVPAPVWMLTGEHDRSAVVIEETRAAAGPHVEVERIGGLALHSYGTPRAQQEVRERVRRWAARAVLVPSGP